MIIVAQPQTTRPPRSLLVVRDPPEGFAAARVDWSAWYLTDEEDMGESVLQNLIIRCLVSSLEQWARSKATRACLSGPTSSLRTTSTNPVRDGCSG